MKEVCADPPRGVEEQGCSNPCACFSQRLHMPHEKGYGNSFSPFMLLTPWPVNLHISSYDRRLLPVQPPIF